MVDRDTLQNPEHNVIYGAILDLREDFIDLKQHVNEELYVQRLALESKAETKDINLWLLWKQSPKWMKLMGAIATAAVAVTSAAIAAVQRIPF